VTLLCLDEFNSIPIGLLRGPKNAKAERVQMGSVAKGQSPRQALWGYQPLGYSARQQGFSAPRPPCSPEALTAHHTWSSLYRNTVTLGRSAKQFCVT
jgi:hypothetical protein